MPTAMWIGAIITTNRVDYGIQCLPGYPGNFHDLASDAADAAVRRMRERKKMKHLLGAQQKNGELSTPRRLVDRYHRGYSTASELMLGILTLTDKSEIREAVEAIPKLVLAKLRDFVDYCTPETRVFNGPPPNMETVRFVKTLLSRRKLRRVN